MKIGLISGSGTYRWPGLEHASAEECATRFGFVELTAGRLRGVEVLHLARHGSGHAQLSNQLNHRANLSALVENGVDAILSFTVCGAVEAAVPLGSVIAFNDFHFPSNRFPDGSPCTWHHTPGAAGRGHWVFDNPFCEPLRRTVLAACRDLEVVLIPEGCYGHVDGPRFNTQSEIAALSAAGVTAVSQTAGPEAELAGEAGVPFVLVGYVTDYANGVSADAAQVTDIAARISQSTEVLAEVANATLPMISPNMLEPAGDFYRFDT